ncbi:hypothetical protein FKM82_020475 [Ascaphus truei]
MFHLGNYVESSEIVAKIIYLKQRKLKNKNKNHKDLILEEAYTRVKNLYRNALLSYNNKKELGEITSDRPISVAFITQFNPLAPKFKKSHKKHCHLILKDPILQAHISKVPKIIFSKADTLKKKIAPSC